MKFKYTLIAQLLDVLRGHAVSALIFSLFWFMFVAVTTTNVGAIIFACIGTIGYTISMYNCGFRAVTNDKKTYSTQSPNLKKAAILTAFLVAANIIMLICYKLAWAVASKDGAMTSVGGIIGNVLSMAWFSPYEKFLGMYKGVLSLRGYIIIFLLPVIGTAAGYISGYFGIDVNDKLIGFMYEKTKKNKKGVTK